MGRFGKTVGATNFEAIKEEIKQELLQNKISGYTADVLKERIKEADIEIYDPYFEYRFESSYEDEYDLIHPNDFKADLIFPSLTTIKQPTTLSAIFITSNRLPSVLQPLWIG